MSTSRAPTFFSSVGTTSVDSSMNIPTTNEPTSAP